MHNMLYLLEPGAVVVSIVLFSFLITIFLRGRRIPECFQCGAIKVRPSRLAGPIDFAASAFLIRPYRCMGCLARFHALSLTSRDPIK
jgi:hypothetical protein